MRQSVFVVVTAICLVVASAGLFINASRLKPSIPLTSSGATEEVVRSFYTAVNEYLATGSPGELRRQVAPDYRDVEPLPGVEEGRRGLEISIERLALYLPNAQLVLESVVATDNRAMARVRVDGNQPEFLFNGTAGQPLALWSAVEVFTIEKQQIVARQARAEALLSVGAVSRTMLNLDAPSRRNIWFDRVTIEPGAQFAFTVPDVAQRVFVERGTLAIAIAAAEFASISKGSGAIVPAGANVVLRNDTFSPVVALILGLIRPGARDSVDGPSGATQPGVALQSFTAGAAVTLPAGPLELAVEEWTFASQGQVEAVDIAGSLILVVEKGSVQVMADQEIVLQYDPAESIQSLQRAVISHGSVAIAQRGATVLIKNHDEQNATLLIVSVRPGLVAPDL